MIFYSKKSRLMLMKTVGYALCLTAFAVACALNAAQAGGIAHFTLMVSLIAGFLTYTAGKNASRGLIYISQEGPALRAGFREVNIDWDNIEKIEVFSNRGRKTLGIALKNIDFAQKAFRRILELNREHTGYEFCFDGKYLDVPVDEIASKLNGFLSDPEKRAALPEKHFKAGKNEN